MILSRILRWWHDRRERAAILDRATTPSAYEPVPTFIAADPGWVPDPTLMSIEERRDYLRTMHRLSLLGHLWAERDARQFSDECASVRVLT